VTNGQPCTLHCRFEAERAADQKRHKISPPPSHDICRLFDENAALIDAVPWQIGAKVGTGSNANRLPASGFGDIQNRTGPGITLAEPQKIEGEIFRYDDEVRLQIIGRKTAFRTGQHARPRLRSNGSGFR
jgi:hypothetical protein